MNEQEKQYRLENPLTSTPMEELAEYFREWQIGGSGRRPCGQASGLEPPLMSFVEYCQWRIKGTRDPIPLPPVHEEEGKWSTAQIILSKDTETTWEQAHQFIRSIHNLRQHRFSYEVVGTAHKTGIQFGCSDADLLSQLIRHLEAVYPDIGVKDGELDSVLAWAFTQYKYEYIAEYGLQKGKGFVFPLQILAKSKLDPWTGILSVLSRLKEDEVGIVQIIFRPAVQNWAGEIEGLASFLPMTLSHSESRQENFAELIQEKIAHPLYSVRLRLAVGAKVAERVQPIFDGLSAPLSLLNRHGSNGLTPLASSHDSFDDLQTRQTWVTGMLLNSEELTSLLHLPPPAARTAKLIPEEAQHRTRPAPSSLIGGTFVTNDREENERITEKALSSGTLLGLNCHQEKLNLVTLSNQQRIKHAHVIGKTGTGKSTLLLSLMFQDMRRGNGFALLDPHGDLVDEVLARVPEHRYKDVILFDPGDEEHPVGFNILAANSPTEKNLLASDLVGTFQRLATTWGDQMTSVLSNAILAVLESKESGTLIDLRRFLIDAEFRREYLETIDDPEVLYFWRKQYPLLPGAKSIGPILTRLDTFLRTKVVRNIVGQRFPQVDFDQILNEQKIFLGKLPQGIIGKENSYLLGTLLVAKFHQAALARQPVPESERPDFFLYIDEFHHFITPSMSSILTGARKYHLGLILAHQEFQQLRKENSDVAGSVLANSGTRICFQLGDDDADKFAEGFGFFEADDLKNLGVGEAICRVERAQDDFNLFSIPAPAQSREEAQGIRDKVGSLSAERYAANRAAVEADIYKRMGLDDEEPVQEKRKTTKPEPPGESKLTMIVEDALSESTPVEIAPELPNAIARREAKPKPKPIPREVPLPGKGGPDHKRLQETIRRYAEDPCNYRAHTERRVEGGEIDLLLDWEGKPLIACEISKTNTAEYEIHNLEKCLRQPCEFILFISEEEKKLKRVRELAEARFQPDQLKRIQFCAPNQAMLFIRQESARRGVREQTVGGIKSKRVLELLGPQEEAQLLKMLGEVVHKAKNKPKEPQ